jgi:MFS transporter, NNP family, nitrate/nitrite transporter
VFSLTNAQTLFAFMGISALICASLCAFFLKEPQGSFAEDYDRKDNLTVLPDTVSAGFREQK